MLPLMVFLGMVAGAWYLLIVRPQKDQQTRHGRLVERLREGDHVLTVGGIYGRVVAVEGASVVLELAPGLRTRIATDGIARIVHGGDVALPETPVTERLQPHVTNHQVMEDDMHQPPHQQQPQPHQPMQMAHEQPLPVGYQPQAMPQPQMTYGHAAPQRLAPPPAPMVMQPMQPQVVSEHGTTTLRAHVVTPPALPSFTPRPWNDAAPVNAAPTQVSSARAPLPSLLPPPPTIVAPFGQQAPPLVHQAPQTAYASPQMYQHAHPQQPQLQPAPALYAQPMVPQPVQYVPQPAQPQTYAQPQQVAQPMTMPVQPQQYAQPMAAAATHPIPGVAAHTSPVAAVDPEPARRTSRAPQGMGSSLRLDDPSIRDTMGRARGELSELAQEYRKVTAPLVDTSHAPQLTPVRPVQTGPAVHVGYDPHGAPLFAHAAPVPGATHYPGPARPPHAEHGMPRPVVTQGTAPIDPALQTSAAFQRRTPYAPEAVGQAMEPAPV